jgi:superfamily II DNA or RNA helicase
MRGDKVKLGSVFEKVVYECGMKQGIDEGYLVGIKQLSVTVEGLDFSTVKKVGGDFDIGQLEEILSADRPVAEIAAGIAQIVNRNDSAIVFCAGVKHSRKLAEMLNIVMGGGTAEHVDGGMHKDRRKELIDGFRKGHFPILCNCDVLIEGFNAPRTKYVILARPIGHVGRYIQILGRGTRTYPSGIIDQPGMDRESRLAAIAASEKPHLTVLDFRGNAGRHRVIDTVDIFAGNDPPEVQAIARELIDRSQGSRPTQDAIDTARLLQEVFSEQPEIMHQVVARAAKVHQQEVDVFSPDIVTNAPKQAPQREPISTGQLWFIVHNVGMPRSQAQKLTKKQASGVIARWRREQEGK